MTNHLVLFAFEKQVFYHQALFLIVSAFTFKSCITQIHVYSDNDSWIPPSFLPQLNCVLLSDQQINQMKGDHVFIHRAKILIIKEICSRVSGNVLYIDSDCFIKHGLDHLFAQLTDFQFVMHKYEFVFNNNFNQSINQVVEYSKKEGILVDGEENYSMWNAGVIGGKALILSNVCDSVLSMTDLLLKHSKYHTLEQFAFSVCLQRVGTIVPAHRYIYHYWNSSEKKYMFEHIGTGVYVHSNKFIKHFEMVLRKSHLRILKYRIRNSYIYSCDQALSNFDLNVFSKGYWYTFKAVLCNCMLDYDFRSKFRFHLTRHIKHIAKQILKK